jgi:hypothetical protein
VKSGTDATPRESGPDATPCRIAVVVDVDGVVSPVHGRTAWGDDVICGNVFGPVFVSPQLCARLDALDARDGVRCWWLTSWSGSMRAAMSPFPGRRWPVIADGTGPAVSTGRRWWKLSALETWLACQPALRAVAWCDDHLTPGSRQRAVHRAASARGVAVLAICPNTAVGLTPGNLARLETWLSSAVSGDD